VVREIRGNSARVDYGGGLVREAGLEVTPEAAVGDYVLVHAGYVIGIIDQREAEETLRLIREAGGLGT
jgi:hydrogenase expression/formation protein HypC